ncbi:response regulator transcription factor [Luteolibacter sp. AS25]|uniref:response regulator transcription factor n=1 Tax=Luteolibacter sp. AS25 TaxID=3135776 RepID=UPI00398AEB16
MKILIVEDNPDLLRSLAASLREENYAVDTAADGGEGLYLAKECDYDCIVLDGMLPVMDGWDLLAELRKLKKTPVLMLTARDAVDDRIRGLDGGADDYLVKPFDLEELLARLRALIRRASGEASRVIEIEGVEIDFAKRYISRHGMVVQVTAREYALVEYLALKRGRVVTRSELYEHLFDSEDDSISNLLDVHVSNVRKKLGPDLIVTRRGHGYLIPQ